MGKSLDYIRGLLRQVNSVLDGYVNKNVSYIVKYKSTLYYPPIDNKGINIYSYQISININGVIKNLFISSKELLSLRQDKECLGMEIVLSTNKIKYENSIDILTIETKLIKYIKRLINKTLKSI